MDSSEKEKSNEKIIDLLYQLGTVYLEKKDYDNAIDRFKQMIELGEEHAKVYLNLSKAYILKEQFDHESQIIFEQALKFEPENPVLNIVLSQLYLKQEREDEEAFQVYKNALKQNPQHVDAIISKLIKLSFHYDKIDVTRELMQYTVDMPEKLSNLLPLYLLNEWKHQGFDHVTQYLKKVIEKREDLRYYRWLVINFLQAERQSLAPFELSLEDLKLCNKYVNSIDRFDLLLDIYLEQTIERLLLKYSKKILEAAANPIEEYEIFLSEHSFSNIWEKAISRNDFIQNISHAPEGAMWKKLQLWHVSDEKDESNRMESIQNQAEILMVVRLIGSSAQDFNDSLLTAVQKSSEPNKSFLGGFKSTDGFILFWKDLTSPLNMAIDFLQNQSVPNSTRNHRFQFLIHKLSIRGKEKDKNKRLTDDLQLALSCFQLEREMFFQDDHWDQRKAAAKDQLLVTLPVKEKITKDDKFFLEPVEFIAQHPRTQKPVTIFNINWDDALAQIRRGEIHEISGYRLLKELHTNQVFASFKAINSFLDRLVILKILRNDFRLDKTNSPMPELFLKEAKFLGKLSHPNVALLYDIGQEHDLCFMAREFVEGAPLEVQRSLNQKIDWKRTLRICLNITQTLNYTHRLNIFHGKLQPSNIFVLENNHIKIADFQMVSFAVPLITYQSPSLKYLTYFAPEQIDQYELNSQTDLYSLGVIMYEMFTDHNPFDAVDRNTIFDQIFNKIPEPLTAHNPDLPSELNDMVFKAIAKAPDQRYSNMDELEMRLAELVNKFGS